MGMRKKRQRRGFNYGRQKQAIWRGVPPAPPVSVSAKKLQGSGLPEPKVPADRRATGYRLIELGNLQAYLLDVLKATCLRCKTNRLVICENEDKRRGLMSVLRLRCLDCARNGK